MPSEKTKLSNIERQSESCLPFTWDDLQGIVVTGTEDGDQVRLTLKQEANNGCKLIQNIAKKLKKF